MTAALALLNPAAQVALASCEQRIERGLKTFIDVGQALAEIRDSRLYKGTHDTFEDYCRDRWGFSRQRAQQFTAAAELATTMVDTGLPEPTNERQTRALAAVPEPERAEVWREANERTDGKPTAKIVREIAEERATPAEPERKPLGDTQDPGPAAADDPSAAAGPGSTSPEPETVPKPTLTLVPDPAQVKAAEQRDARALLSRGVDLLAPARWNEGHFQAWIKQMGGDDDELAALKQRARAAIAVLTRVIEEAGR